MNERPKRSWGYWTRVKLGILEDYLPAFLNASKGKASEFIFLDAFAGEGHGRDRVTGSEFKGSARIALDVKEAGGFTKLRYFEQGQRARELEEQLRRDYPNRDVKVYQGDCNDQIPIALDELEDVKWAPTFAFIDPDGMETRWQTLERIADHKRGYRSKMGDKPEFKIETWLLFPTPGLMRTLILDGPGPTTMDVRRATALFGADVWRRIYEQRKADKIDPATAREAYLNLIRWRLEKDLGYQSTHPLELKNMRGLTVYHMLFATDHPAGARIMSDLYSKAAREIPDMRKEAQDQQIGQLSMEIGSGAGKVDATYTYEPPWDPS